MKNLILLTTLLVSFNVNSQTADPSQFCMETNQCTKKMQSILDGYKDGNANFSKESLTGFSGSCFHLNDLYDSEHEHHGAFTFERDGINLMTTGIFSFFADEDPYQNMSSVELRNWFVENNSNFSKAIEKSDHVELQYLSPRSDYSYWFSENIKNKKFYVIGKQIGEDYLGYIFCEMNRR